MVIYDQWITPTFNQDWNIIDDDKKYFILNILLNKSGRVDKRKLEEIPEGTTNIRIVIESEERYCDYRFSYLDFDKGYIPSSVSGVKIEYNYDPFRVRKEHCHGSDGLPDSVTMLTVPSLPFLAAPALKKIRFLKVEQQGEAIEIDMVPPTIEYLWIGGSSQRNGEFIVHSIPNTVKELVVDSYVLDGFRIKPTFTSPIHIRYPSRDNRDRKADDELQNTLCDLNVQSITPTHTNQPYSFRTFYLDNDNNNDDDDDKYDLEIEKKEEKMDTERNADKELNNDQDEIEIDSNSTHPLKKRKIDQNHGDQDLLVTKQDEYNEEEEGYNILIPSSIQSICFNIDDTEYRSLVRILDKDDYYSMTPTPPKIRQGLRVDYNNPLNSNNLPLSLKSFKCKSDMNKLDLSEFESIKELNIRADAITYYPPNEEALKLKSPTKDGFQLKFNKHLIKSLVYSCKNPWSWHNWSELRKYGLSYLKELLPTLPNVQYLSSEFLDFEVPASVQELKCLHKSFICTDARPISSPPFETLHLDLDYYLEKHSQTQENQRGEKIIKHYEPHQLPMHNTFFKIWRNIYLKPLVLEALYDLTKSPLRFDSETGTLEHIERFKQYNIFVERKDGIQLGPALLKFDKADQIHINTKEKDTTNTNLSSFISKSIRKLRCRFTKGIPDWITHLNLGDIGWSDHEVGEIPPSVTNLTINNNDERYIGKIPPSVRYLTLNNLMDNQAYCIPPSVTHLSLANTAFNSINKTDIPSTVQRIEFKKLFYREDKGEYDIPSFISSQLVNGVFYIYSKSRNRITIPSNTTHLFWLDNQYIDNDGDGINIPPLHFNQSLASISFPPKLKYLSFNGKVRDIQEQYLPNGLSHLSIGEYTYDIKSLPQSVHHLELNSRQNDYPIPPQVKHLKFQSSSKIFLPTTIKSFISPNSIVILNEPTDSPSEKSSVVSSFISDSTSIHLYSYDFNYFILPHTLGNNIKSITFSYSFNQVLIKGSIPNSVEKLVFGDKFNHKLNKSILPTSLLTLVLGRNFDQDLNDNLPSSLTELVLNTESKPSITSSSQFPPNLKKLSLPCYDGVLDIIPTTINHLEFNRSIAQQKYVMFPIELVPSHVTTLVLNDSMRIHSYDLIPASITSIKLCESITPDTKIPCTVESVVLPISFNQPLDTILQTIDDDDNRDDGDQ
ncbi:hypothetical protein CYY_007254 [Polysphondylium violaceum]|uniref:FNIP repeat-containing protein n=1 Tax=Polysphondylium violaceum TaxID=133409 RepID=A0A8J4UXT3_9MYCE|nr:hypothetical protein CYY_007254 [Polysphondylium violaceum]